MAVEKKIHFFGWRSLYQAYLNHGVETLVTAAALSPKTSKKLTIDRPLHPFAPYFKQLGREGWTLCGSFPEGDDYVMLASTPEKKALGLEIEVEGTRNWLVSPPPSKLALRALIEASLRTQSEPEQPLYHGIFLSHTKEDKPFVNRLKAALNERGVTDVWVDEAEIMVGESLITKIEDAITKALPQPAHFALMDRAALLMQSGQTPPIASLTNFLCSPHSAHRRFGSCL